MKKIKLSATNNDPWTTASEQISTLVSELGKKQFAYPLQSQCITPGDQDYIWVISTYLRSLVGALQTDPTKINSTSTTNYKNNILSIKNNTLTPPSALQFTLTDGVVEITPALSKYNNFYSITLFNFCSNIIDFSSSLQEVQNCLVNTQSSLDGLKTKITNSSFLSSCNKDPSSCISKNPNSKQALVEVTPFDTYISALSTKFKTLLPSDKAPINLSSAQKIVNTFNNFAKTNSSAPAPNMVLSKPISPLNPIQGCAYGLIPTYISSINETFNKAVTACTGPKSCAKTTLPVGDFPPFADLDSFDALYQYTCTAIAACPVSTRDQLCLLNSKVYAMTKNHVWLKSIMGANDLLTTFFDACKKPDINEAKDAYEKLVFNSIIPTAEIDPPNVAVDIAKAKAAAKSLDLNNMFLAYASYFNKMRTWLQFYFGPLVGGFIVKALSENYLDWYNKNEANPKNADYQALLQLLWTPDEISRGTLDTAASTLLSVLTSSIYTDLQKSIQDIKGLNNTVSSGKYILALGFEYSGKTTIIDTLKKLNTTTKPLGKDLASVTSLTKTIVNEFIKLLKDPTKSSTFSTTVTSNINSVYTVAFKQSIANATTYITNTYTPKIAAIKKTYPNITECGTPATATLSCGSQYKGAQSSIWQDTGSIWSGFPAPADFTSSNKNSFSQAFDAFFKKNAQQGIFNYKLSFAQLDVITDIVSGIEVIPGKANLKDTILPYIVKYKSMMGYNSQQTAVGLFLTAIRTSLKKSTNNKGNLGVSFGGENASGSDNRILPNGSTNTKLAATNFYNYFLKFIDSADFDMENSGFTPADDQVQFFTDIRALILKDGPQIRLTLLGDPNTSKTLGMQPLLDNKASLFDGINLMLYGNGSNYYITANAKTSWSLVAWAKALGIDKLEASSENLSVLSKLRPCLQDRTPYQNTAADQGETSNWAIKAMAEITKKYNIDITKLNRAEAAWFIIRQVWDDTLTQFGFSDADKNKFLDNSIANVSWWPDNNYHGSIKKGDNQYTVQQTFAAYQILWKSGYNPATLELLSEE